MVTITACWPESPASTGSKAEIDQELPAMINDKEMEVIDYEEMKYPKLPLLILIRGIVVVQASLKEDGTVSDAFPLFGSELLIPDCLSNIKKWRFRPNAKRAVVTYQFKITDEIAPEKQELTIFHSPNLMTVMASGIRMPINE